MAITSLTVGYGDVVPVTSAEKVYVTCMIYFAAGLFGYALTNIGNIFA
jgi:hypothetical protein